MKNNVKLFKLFICLLVSIAVQSQTSNVSGVLKKWHKIAVTVTLPGTPLDESSSTFKDHRVDVIFTSPQGNQIRVPGFFAADADAANTGATSGNKFVAYLRPNQTGTWTYQALYYKESGVAIKWLNQLPAPTYTLNGTIGSISASDKDIPDFRAQGRLQYQVNGNTNQQRYLRFEDSKEYFLKLGPDSPENLLNYEDFDFDGTRNTCGRCTAHTYAPHSSNYKTGDLTWKNGKGKNIIGVLNYLKEQKMNAISMSLFGGDDPNVFPWTVSGNKSIYDVSKLAQWEMVFDHAEKNGLLLHFKLAENENWDALDLTQLRIYYREMVARFGHHLALEWNISEEYRGTAQSAIARIDWLAALDPWKNHRVIHTYPGEHKKYQEWLDLDAKLTGASIQTSNANNYSGAFSGNDGILTWINKSKAANSAWVVTSDEQNTGERGVFTTKEITNSNVVKEARTRILWKTLIAGGAGIMWYGGSIGDFSTENFNRFNTLFQWSRYAILDFFKKNTIAFWEMENNDGLVTAANAHCLASEGNEYVIYLENGGTTNLNLSGTNKTFNVRWFDPRNGGALQTGNIELIAGGSTTSIGNPPSSSSSDWVVFVTANEVTTGGEPTGIPTPTTCDADFAEKDKRVIIEAENLDLSGTSWVKKTDKPGSTGSGYISWEGSNNFAAPSSQKLTATIKITNPGRYRFQWRNTFGKGSNTTEHNDSWLRFPDASDFYAERGDSKVYPIGSGKTPNASKGGGADGWFKVWLSGNGNWSWYSRTWDSNSHLIYVEFDQPGVYTMEISGRSQYHLLDRIILYQDGIDAQAISLAETACEPSTTPPPTPTEENKPPTVAFTSPANGTKFKLNDAMTFTVDASDLDGRVSNVLFFADGNLLGSDNTSPYSITQTATKVGEYKISAIATDNKGDSATAILTVDITEPLLTPTQVPTAPEVQLIGITEGSEFELGTPVNIGATATDADGTIAKVEFFAKGVILIGEDTTSAYTAVFRPAFAGTYVITAKATDNQGNVTTSEPINVVIKELSIEEETDIKPEVVVTGIDESTSYELSDGVTIGATATDADGVITKVVFYAKGVTKLGEVFEAPYSVKFRPAFTGAYSITARATDNDGNVTISDPVIANIVETNNDPVVASVETVSLNPVHDAYLDYATRYNSTIVRVDKGRREAYFMFDISNIEGTAEEAVLQLTINGDSGNGTLQVFEGASSSWGETILSTANKPAKSTTAIGTISGSFNIGQTIQIPINVSTINGDKLTLIVTQASGNDVAFGSKENTANIAPALVITYKSSAAKTATSIVAEALSIKVYPNPAVSNAVLEGGQLKGSLVQLYTSSGVLVYSDKAESNTLIIPTDTLAAGVYFIKTLSGSGVTDMLQLGVN